MALVRIRIALLLIGLLSGLFAANQGIRWIRATREARRLADPAYRVYITRMAEFRAFCAATEREAPPLRREHIPGSEAKLAGIRYRYNAEGLRDDREVPRAKPPGERRVAFLSDSTGSGFCVPQNQTCAAVMEKDLPRTRVLDFSINGSDLCDAHYLLEHRALAFQPDVVAILFYLIDVGDEHRIGAPPPACPPPPTGLALWRTKIELLDWAMARFEKRPLANGDDAHHHWPVFSHNIRTIAALLRARQIKVVAGIAPMRQDVRPQWAKLEKRTRQLLESEGVKFVDQWAAFAGQPQPGLFFPDSESFAYPSDPFHATAAGHAILGHTFAAGVAALPTWR